MWVVGHAQVGWFLTRFARLERRDRSLVAWCGILPDLDAITLLGGHDAYLRGHHVYLHNLPTAVLLGLGAAAAARRRFVTGLLGLAAALLHFASDGFGYLELRPLWPFSRAVWWPNGGRHWVAGVGEVLVPIVLLGLGLLLFARDRFSLLEAISPRLDAWCVARLRQRGLRLTAAVDMAPESPPRSLIKTLREFAAELAIAAVLMTLLGWLAHLVLEIVDRPDPQRALLVGFVGYGTVRWLMPAIVQWVLDGMGRRFAVDE